MPDLRCYCETPPRENVLELSAEESLHLVAANRARVGDPVVAFDGRGAEWDAVVLEANKRRAHLKVGVKRIAPPPAQTIALAQALPKGKLLEAIVRRATEIGIQRIHPLLTAHAVSRPNEGRAGKDQKWQHAVIEGAKQSGNPFLPEIESMETLGRFLDVAQNYELKLIASLRPGAASIKKHLERFRAEHDGKNPQSAVWLVGPEGDFSPAETDVALDAGFLPVTLGPYVLRCETAAIAALSIIRSELAG